MDPGNAALPELVPARMLNEHTYCPRLAYLEWVQGDFADSADTVEGRFHHRKVDAEGGALPGPDEMEGARFHARSLMLSAPIAGLIARIDLVEADGDLVTPIDYKRGKAPDLAEGAWEPERVQLCVQAMILEENGYRVDHGILYFVASRERIDIAIDAALRARTLELLAEMRVTAAQPTPPPPLVDSPKCPRCSLVGICLPDEVNLLRIRDGGERVVEAEEPVVEVGRVRRLVPGRDDALPLYVQSAGARVGKRGEELVVELRDGTKEHARIGNTSHVALFGNVQISTQALQELCSRGITVSYLSSGGWLYGITRGMDHKNIDLRRQQFEAAASRERCLALARRLTAVKIRNCRTMVRRNVEDAGRTTDRMRELVASAEAATSLESLLGIEGTAARLYFEAFSGMIRPPAESARMAFDFDGRNRRPPRDPINALLSFGYAILAKDVAVALISVGFDPYLGFYHQPRYGRLALALDVMEEFRPLIVDSVVLSAVNTGVVKASDFIRRGGAVSLTSTGRTAFLRAYERRMDELATHPVFGYRISYRRIIEVQIRLLARHLSGELAEYPPFATR
ncbi:MAG: CRISPR-associated endonuclease Cas1 [Proteobacteria bacterium]|nr:CRISPR-associated endonuclease Cas1 [Pseudomonadota bacterium]